jgi:excisionase family DNA binding protein
MEKRLLSVDEVSEYTGLSINTLYAWVSQKKIPFVKIGRLTKFDRKDIDSWIDSNKNEVRSFDLPRNFV